jgi:hypothetical protein
MLSIPCQFRSDPRHTLRASRDLIGPLDAMRRAEPCLSSSPRVVVHWRRMSQVCMHVACRQRSDRSSLPVAPAPDRPPFPGPACLERSRSRRLFDSWPHPHPHHHKRLHGCVREVHRLRACERKTPTWLEIPTPSHHSRLLARCDSRGRRR